MQTYILKRLLLFIPTLIGVVLINFAIIQFVPGGPVEQFVAKQRHGQRGEAVSDSATAQMRKGIDQEQIEQLKRLYEFDKPWYERLASWSFRLFTFQFGESYFHHKQVTDLVIEKMPVSISLGVLSFLITYLTCIPLGIAKAVREGSAFDAVTSVAILFGYSIPSFVIGVILMILFGGGTFWDVFPIRGLVSDNFESLSFWAQIKDYGMHLVMPVIAMTAGSLAVMTMLTKSTVIENIRQQYVTTARAKGVSPRKVLWKHVFRNSMIPLVTGFAGGFLTIFFTGSLLIETQFSLDGMGLLSFQSVMQRDYPVVMATQFFFSILYVLGNLLGDIMYVMVDPRINFDDVAG